MRFDRITFHYGKRTMFSNFTLEIEEGRITCLLGASGIGKTTLLRLAAGLERPQAGRVARCTDTESRTGYVFQEPRLLPWKTVLANVQWVADEPGNAPVAEDILAYLEEAGLAHALSDYPDQLSGGMKQRVSMVRAFVSNPGLLLMDEPFQSLDPSTRREMMNVLRRLWRRNKPTVLLVTHDPEEALALGEHIVLLGGNPVECQLRISTTDVAGEPRFSEADADKLKQWAHMQGTITVGGEERGSRWTQHNRE